MTDDPTREAMTRRDRELGAVLSSWATTHGVEVLGPLEAPGMDPTWIARFRSESFEADVHLFYGPLVDVSAFRPNADEGGYLVGGEEHLTDERLVELLDDVASATRGGPTPNWLRHIPV